MDTEFLVHSAKLKKLVSLFTFSSKYDIISKILRDLPGFREAKPDSHGAYNAWSS